MPKTWVAAPGTKCHECKGTGPIVHHCDGMEGLHCMTCHDSWRMRQVTEGLLEEQEVKDADVITAETVLGSKKQCLSIHRENGQCVLDEGHTGEHDAITGESWRSW